MDTGKLKSNNSFYQGYEDETEVFLCMKDMPEFCIHIWDGYFEDILSEPHTTANGWIGFTRDYQECLGAWGNDSYMEIVNLPEYLDDLRDYRERLFEYEESKDVLALLIEFMKCAEYNKQTVIVRTA
jgi:hypothetical protein